MSAIFPSNSCRFRTDVKKSILTLSLDCKKRTQAGQKSVNDPVVKDQPQPGHSLWWLSHTNIYTSKMIILKTRRLGSWHEEWLISCCHSCPLPKPQAHVPITLLTQGKWPGPLPVLGATANLWGRTWKLQVIDKYWTSNWTFENALNIFLSQNCDAHVFSFPQPAFLHSDF